MQQHAGILFGVTRPMGHDKDNMAQVDRLRKDRIERERGRSVPDAKPEVPQVNALDANLGEAPKQDENTCTDIPSGQPMSQLTSAKLPET
jgi:hypothetical protein